MAAEATHHTEASSTPAKHPLFREVRDTTEWARELYVPFAESCESRFEDCRDQGWSVLVLAMLATVGHRDEAIKKAMEIPSDAFTSAGGNGHSLTNTLWYLATRPAVIGPLVIDPSKAKEHKATSDNEKKTDHQSDTDDSTKGQSPGPAPAPHKKFDEHFDCSCPDSCNEKALDRFAFGHTCRDRIVWLITQEDHKEWDACHKVGVEFPGHCGACDPRVCSTEEESHSKTCPPCSKDICRSHLNLCPVDNAPFLCTNGPSVGGCSRSPWILEDAFCDSCCELTHGCEDG